MAKRPAKKPAEGAIFTPLMGDRRVNVYPVQQSELKMLGTLGAQAAFWLSVGSAAVGLLAGCVWDMFVVNDKQTSREYGFLIAVILFAAISLGICWWNVRSGKSLIQIIEQETTTKDRK